MVSSDVCCEESESRLGDSASSHERALDGATYAATVHGAYSSIPLVTNGTPDWPYLERGPHCA